MRDILLVAAGTFIGHVGRWVLTQKRKPRSLFEARLGGRRSLWDAFTGWICWNLHGRLSPQETIERMRQRFWADWTAGLKAKGKNDANRHRVRR